MCPFLVPYTNTLKVYFCYCMYCAQLYLRVFAIVTASCAVSNRESMVPSLICVLESMLLKEPSRLRTLAKIVKLMQNAVKHLPARGIRYMLSHMLPVGGTVGPSKAESAPGVHGSGSSQVPFTPVSSAASASLAGCQTWELETDSEELLELDSVLSVQVAYPVSQRGTHHPHHVSSAPSFIVLSPHIPLDALGLKITGKRDNRSPDNSALHMLGSSLHTNSVFSHSTRHLESLPGRHSAEVVRSEQQQLLNWQECWSLEKSGLPSAGSSVCPAAYL